MNWKNIKIAEIQGIEKVVAEFYVSCVTYIPNCQFRVKVIEDIYGKYSARVNLAIRNSRDGSPEWVGGNGDSIDARTRKFNQRTYKFYQVFWEKHQPSPR
jgi:hypothetical protein